MLNLLKEIWNAFLKLTRKTNRFYKNVIIDEQPEKIVPHEALFVVMGGTEPKWLIFRCPCGCGDEIKLSLMQNYRPNWTISQDINGLLTVFPSVNIVGGCGSHFWIRKNKVEWAK